MNISYNSPDEYLNYFLKSKIGYFSQAKNQNNAIQLSKLFVNGSSIISWRDFKKEALLIVPDYNKEILQSEHDCFISMGQNYSAWQRIEREKDVLPYLKYDAIGDGNDCDICKKLNKIILPVDNPFWGTYFPPNCSACRCLVLQYSNDEVKHLTDLSKKKLITPEHRFALNVGKHALITLYSN